MSDKDNVSMTTVQMKPDYAASEVYSTASEAPPLGLFNLSHQQAYKRQSNSVKIAKIAALTIVASSFILGAFILASSYLQAKASCDQVQALDSVLEKELMLETLQQVNKELPRAEALLGKENAEDDDLQNLDKDDATKKIEIKQQKAPKGNNVAESNDSDNSYSDSDETDEAQKWPNKVPLELDLSDLAAALLQNNKKSRMNCVVERKHAEEFVDSPSKTVSLPFGMNLTTDPKKARITGERISIFCEGGNENKEQEAYKPREEENDENDEDFETVRAVYLPYQRVPIPFGRIPQQFPLTHMPQRMMPPQMQPQQQMVRQMPPPFQLPMRPPMPPQMHMQAPHPEPQAMHQPMPEQPQLQTVRIHVQQIPFREIHVADDVPVQIPAQQQELPHFQVQRMPLVVALQRAGITPQDLSNIKRIAEERITDALSRIAAEEATESNENNSNNSDEDNNDSQTSSQNSSEQEFKPSLQEQQQQQENQQKSVETEPSVMAQVPPQRLILRPLPDQPRDTMTPPMPDQPNMMQFNRASYGRSLAQPVRIPVPMMPLVSSQSSDSNAQTLAAVASELERPRFLQPRSV